MKQFYPLCLNITATKEVNEESMYRKRPAERPSSRMVSFPFQKTLLSINGDYLNINTIGLYSL